MKTMSTKSANKEISNKSKMNSKQAKCSRSEETTKISTIYFFSLF